MYSSSSFVAKLTVLWTCSSLPLLYSFMLVMSSLLSKPDLLPFTCFLPKVALTCTACGKQSFIVKDRVGGRGCRLCASITESRSFLVEYMAPTSWLLPTFLALDTCNSLLYLCPSAQFSHTPDCFSSMCLAHITAPVLKVLLNLLY